MDWMKKANTMTRLMAAFGLMLALTVAIGLNGLYRMSQLQTQFQTVMGRDVKGLNSIKSLETAKMEAARFNRNAILYAGDKNKVEAAEKSMAKIMASLRSDLLEAEQTSVTAEGKAQLAKIEDILPPYEAGNNEVFKHARAGDAKAALTAMEKNKGNTDKLNDAVRGAARAKEKKIEQMRAEFDENCVSTRRAMFIALGFVVLLGLGLSYVLARSFSLPLQAMASVLGHVATGDLTQHLEVDAGGEIGTVATALNKALKSMRDTLSEVQLSSLSLSSSSQQLAAAAEALASGTQEQAASLEETSASLEEITATVRQNADSARQAKQLASGSREAAEKGGSVVTSAVSAMSEINNSSTMIADIISAMDEIAFQTNLLAVNAAVEAARAGEQGRGFAVVAAEVRSLAQRSAGAAREIKMLIRDSLRKVENGSSLVNKSGETLYEIVASVKRVTDIVGEIAAASAEQSTGIEQINAAMMQMDNVTQATTAQTEELSSTAQNLHAQAGHLQTLVRRFTIQTADETPEPPRPVMKPVAARKPAADAAEPQAPKPAAQPVSAGHHDDFEEF